MLSTSALGCGRLLPVAFLSEERWLHGAHQLLEVGVVRQVGIHRGEGDLGNGGLLRVDRRGVLGFLRGIVLLRRGPVLAGLGPVDLLWLLFLLLLLLFRLLLLLWLLLLLLLVLLRVLPLVAL